MMLALEALEQSILFFPLALGIYISFSILKTTDMTSEGSFVLGAGVFARLLSLEFTLVLAALMAIILGGVAGVGVSLIQAKDRINPLIAGIIGLFILYSLNFQIMGRPNIGLHQTLPFSKTSLLMVIAVLTLTIMLLFATRFGLLLRAFGFNAKLLCNLGKNVEGYRMFGLSLSNALAAFCGVCMALLNGYADLSMGFGMTLTGIGTVVIGQQLLYRFAPQTPYQPVLEIIACFIGVYLYFLAINGLLMLGVNPIYLKLLLGLILIILLRGKLK